MLNIGEYEVAGFWWAMHGARQSYNSHDKSDSRLCTGRSTDCADCAMKYGDRECALPLIGNKVLGKRDLELLSKLSKAGDDHGKCMRYIVCWVDVTAPLLWWKQEATYKIGTTENSQSTMHTITKKLFEFTDFSNETSLKLGRKHWENVINDLNKVREIYLEYDKHKESLERNNISRADLERSLFEMLPDSYIQTRTMVLNYQVLKHMYHARENHKIGEWHDFCAWIRQLPFAKELIL